MWSVIAGSWAFEPGVTIPAALSGLLYAVGLGEVRVPRRMIASFYGGLAIILVALISPLDEVADALFSAHMAQHLLLILAAAPLLACSRAATVLFMALPPEVRTGLSTVARLVPRARRPIAFWLAFTGIFLFWHLPQAYRWASESETVHIVEHGSLLISAYAFWTMVFASQRRTPNFGARSLFLVITAFVTDLPAVLMIFSPNVLYAVDPQAIAAWGLTPLEDQQLAGLMMWVPASLIFFSAAIWCFARYLSPQPYRPALASI